jgi:hypothetical protein
VGLALLVGMPFASAVHAECVTVPGPPTKCALTKSAPIIFLGTEWGDGYTLHFRVEEAFAGVTSDTIDIVNVPVVEGVSGYVDDVNRYLVFADVDRFMKEPHVGGNCGVGGYMRPASSAGPLLEQLRHEKRGEHVDAIYGRLSRWFSADSRGLWSESELDLGALSDVPLTFQSTNATVRTTTQADGTFVVESLPVGTYRVAADLPPGLELTEPSGDVTPLAPIAVGPDSCSEADLYAMSTTRISGHVFGPDGALRDDVMVQLFRADDHTQSVSSGQWGGKAFAFNALRPGDYVLAFLNGTGRQSSLDPPPPRNPDQPFPLTFYPSAPDLAGASVIHLASGQQVLDADIHLRTSYPTRTLEIAVRRDELHGDWIGPFVTVKTDGLSPQAVKQPATDTYTANLLPDARYYVSARALCAAPPDASTGAAAPDATTDTTVVDGADPSVTRITLTFPPNSCAPK